MGDPVRVASEDRHIQAADVDVELERIRRDDAEDLAVAEALLDRAALRRQVAAAIATNAGSRAQILAMLSAGQPAPDAP